MSERKLELNTAIKSSLTKNCNTMVYSANKVYELNYLWNWIYAKKYIISILTCSSSRFPLCSYFLVCSKNNHYFVGIETLLSRSSLNYCFGNINLVHVTKRGIEYFNIHLQFTSHIKFTFKIIVLFQITAMFFLPGYILVLCVK